MLRHCLPLRSTLALTLACSVTAVAGLATAQSSDGPVGGVASPIDPPPMVSQNAHPTSNAPSPPSPPAIAAPPPAPAVQLVELRPRSGLIVGGSVMLGVSWSITAIAGLATSAVSDICNAATSGAGCPTAAWPLYVPVAGPFIQMGFLTGNSANTARTLLFIDGMVQAGGLAMILVGAFAKKAVPRPAARWQLAPYAPERGIGMGAMLRFE